MKKKWFYDLQETAMKRLNDEFLRVSCNWQVVTKNTVVESYTCVHGYQTRVVIMKKTARPNFTILKEA